MLWPPCTNKGTRGYIIPVLCHISLEAKHINEYGCRILRTHDILYMVTVPLASLHDIMSQIHFQISSCIHALHTKVSVLPEYSPYVKCFTLLCVLSYQFPLNSYTSAIDGAQDRYKGYGKKAPELLCVSSYQGGMNSGLCGWQEIDVNMCNDNEHILHYHSKIERDMQWFAAYWQYGDLVTAAIPQRNNTAHLSWP